MCMKLTQRGLVMFVCPFVRKIQLENHWTDLDEIWYGGCAIGEYPKIILFKTMMQGFRSWYHDYLGCLRHGYHGS
jgi:hypothetical protein